MEAETWIDGWADESRGKEAFGLFAVAGDARYPIPRAELVGSGIKAGTRISFTLRSRKWKGRIWVKKLLARP